MDRIEEGLRTYAHVDLNGHRTEFKAHIVTLRGITSEATDNYSYTSEASYVAKTQFSFGGVNFGGVNSISIESAFFNAKETRFLILCVPSE